MSSISLSKTDSPKQQGLKKNIRIVIIGSRKASTEALLEISKISSAFSELNAMNLPFETVLISGGADGVDITAEKAFGKGRKHIILAYPSDKEDEEHIIYKPDQYATRLVDLLHPFPENIKKVDRPFLERDVLLIIGEKHSDGTRIPSDFVVAWTPDGRVQGGTAMGIRTARHRGIPVFNIAIQKELSALRGVYASLRDGIIPDFPSMSRDITWRNRR